MGLGKDLDVQSGRFGVGPAPNDQSHKRNEEGRGRPHEDGGRDGGTSPQAGQHQGLPDTTGSQEGARNRLSLRASKGTNLPTPGCCASGLLNSEDTTCCFKAPGWVTRCGSHKKRTPGPCPSRAKPPAPPQGWPQPEEPEPRASQTSPSLCFLNWRPLPRRSGLLEGWSFPGKLTPHRATGPGLLFSSCPLSCGHLTISRARGCCHPRKPPQKGHSE